MHVSDMRAARRMLGAVLVAAAMAASLTAATARADSLLLSPPKAVILPLIVGWFDGKPAPYISTEASDPGVAASFGANYVPRLANAANTAAVDDIYTITNFTQTNVIPSAPMPAGPDNQDPNYTPLWQVSMVTWNAGTTPTLLTSEAAILAAQTSGLVTIVKSNIVVNCSVVYTSAGGLFPHAHLLRPH